jgi:hypothetical protein
LLAHRPNFFLPDLMKDLELPERLVDILLFQEGFSALA